MPYTLSFPQAFGTGILVSSPSPSVCAAQGALEACIEEFDRIFSRFRADSVVNSPSALRHFPSWADELFEIYDVLGALTDGRFSPLVAERLAKMGYGPLFGQEDDHTLDFGAAGKGFAVDRMASVLSHYVSAYTINAGGDIYTTEHITAGLENPWNFSQALGTVELQPGTALCASSPSRRHWTALDTGEEVHHILDATTATYASWVTVSTGEMCENATTAHPTAWADGLATALFLTEPQRLRHPAVPEWNFARIDTEKKAEQSYSWAGSFFSIQ